MIVAVGYVSENNASLLVCVCVLACVCLWVRVLPQGFRLNHDVTNTII